MRKTLTEYLVELAEKLGDLRRQLRQATRVEVARAIGEALAEVAHTLICGPGRLPPSPNRSHSERRRSEWDEDSWKESPYDRDPWADPDRDYSPNEEERTPIMTPPSTSRRQFAAASGYAAARWCFARTGNIVVSTAFGVAVALFAFIGGPAVSTLLEVFTVAQDLTAFPSLGASR